MKVYDRIVKRRILPHIKHQDIGGKVILIERELTVAEVGQHNGIGAWNFFERRRDLTSPKYDNVKVYYGHVNKDNDCHCYYCWEKSRAGQRAGVLKRLWHLFWDSPRHLSGVWLGYFVTEDELEKGEIEDD